MTARLCLALLFAASAASAAPKVPLLPPLVLPMDRPFITATIAGQPVTLRVDPGVDPWVMLEPAAAKRLGLASDVRPDGRKPGRGTLTVIVGQTEVEVPWSRENVTYAGRTVPLRVTQPAATEDTGADGVVSPAILPHVEVRLERRPATAADRTVTLKAEGPGNILFADTIQADWPLPSGKLEIEFHPFRPVTVASVAAASRLAETYGGKLDGPIRQVPISYGVSRPVRDLVLARAADIAGVRLARMDVRLFDWSGKADLPPDADPEAELTVRGSRGRQRGWPILKLGADVLASCASISWRPQPAQVSLTCPAN